MIIGISSLLNIAKRRANRCVTSVDGELNDPAFTNEALIRETHTRAPPERTASANMGIELYKGRVALVTGASAGIGAAIVQALLRHGLTVVGMARRVTKIQKLSVDGAEGKLHAVQGDVTKEEDILKAFKWIKDNLGGVDVLVNNAGFLGDSDLTVAPTSEWRQILDVNVLGLSICTREAVKSMRERSVDDGYIIHISSVAGHLPPSHSNVAMYSASKWAVTALNEGLRKDLVASNSKIRNTAICPGVVKTELFNSTETYKAEAVYSNLPYLEPEDIANTVVFVLSQPLRVQVHEILLYPTGGGRLSAVLEK